MQKENEKTYFSKEISDYFDGVFTTQSPRYAQDKNNIIYTASLGGGLENAPKDKVIVESFINTYNDKYKGINFFEEGNIIAKDDKGYFVEQTYDREKLYPKKLNNLSTKMLDEELLKAIKNQKELNKAHENSIKVKR